MKSKERGVNNNIYGLGEFNLKEDFLHYLWKFKLFELDQLETVDKKKVVLLKTGIHNKESGPDFFNGLLEIGHQRWAGNIEIHVKSSDWYVHDHEKDPNYDSVVLHVVWEYDVPVFYSNQKEIPTIQLADYVASSVLDSYYDLFSTRQKWILCEDTIGKTDSFILESWLNRLYFERLEKKSQKILKLLKETNNDWEAVLFQLVAKSFGMKLNGEAFLDLSKSFNFSVVRKCRDIKGQLEILLLGQAGFLNDIFEEVAYLSMQKEYQYLAKKLRLTSMFRGQFQFFRLRPNNFPTIRLSQLACLYEEHQNLFSKVIEKNELKELYDLFSVTSSSYWQTHYVFGKESKMSTKRTSKSFTDLIVLNVLIPLKYSYEKYHNMTSTNTLETLIESIKPEKNSIIEKYIQHGVKVKTALDSQGLLELKSTYCDHKRCLDCTIGLQFLKGNPNK
jgi:hypothetical protein